jgi:phosphoglycolate phosphatase-like HAD superfamily hydrolase
MEEKMSEEKTKGTKMQNIWREKIEANLAEYRKQYRQLQANLQALDGAIQALERLLKEDSNGDK